MAEHVRNVVDPSPAAAAPVLRVLADGERVGERYQIRRFVARGGMGEVYEAFDTALGERVALKTLIITAADQAEASEGLLREVRIARRVIHPNVCRILELGIHKRGNSPLHAIPFLTMDFLEGETLRQRITRSGPLSPAQASQIVKGLAAGLDAVHAAGIVHRDFKTENVFLVRASDGSERPLVMDFGLARGFGGSSIDASGGRRLVGTPSYMAPEQLMGQAATAATDVFALGIVLFEMLTGKLPFSGDSFAAVALSRLQQTPPPVSSLVAGIDRAWDGVVGRCLERVPQRRLVVAELVAALDGMEQTTSSSVRRPRTRSIWLAGFAVFVLIGAASSGIFASRTNNSAVRSRSTAAVTATLEDRQKIDLHHPPHVDAHGVRQPQAPAPPKAGIRVLVSPRSARGSAAPAVPRRRGSPARAASPAPPGGAIPVVGTAPMPNDDPLVPPSPRPRHPDDLGDPF